MKTLILIVLLLAILGGAVVYVVKAKKRGAKCIGCPYAKDCSGKCN